MTEALTIETVRIFFLVFLGLIGTVWAMLNNKIKELQESEKQCPIHTVGKDIAEIKNDIKWIKELIEKK